LGTSWEHTVVLNGNFGRDIYVIKQATLVGRERGIRQEETVNAKAKKTKVTKFLPLFPCAKSPYFRKQIGS
jgi:hypothetical protein